MENLTPGEVWAALLGILSGLLIIANVVEKICGTVRKAKAPNEAQNARLDTLEKWREEVDRKLLGDHNRLQAIHTSDQVMLRALIALLDHGIDGNNTSQMQEAKKALQELLISK
jgi:hypothetical protein